MIIYFISIKISLLFIIMMVLSACGGGGDTGSSAVIPTANRLFMHDSLSMTSIANSNPAVGTVNLDTVVTGSNTKFANVDDYALDIENDRIYVSNSTSILVFNSVSNINGNVSPARTITSGSFGAISHLYLDSSNDLLYATDDIVGLWVIANASSTNGNISPVRGISGSIEGSSSFSIHGVAVDVGNDILYLSVQAGSPSVDLILAYNTASTVNGSNVMADRVFTANNTGGNPGQIVLDSVNDRLYMADSGFNAVRVFDNVSTLVGSVDPTRTINLGASISDIKLDLSNNRLYALNVSLLYVVSSASTANGFVAAKALLVPNSFPNINAIAIAP